MAEDHQEQCIITVGEVNSNNPLLDSASVLKLPRSVSSRDLMECFTYNGHLRHLYNLIEDGRSVQIQLIARRSLRSGHCEESGRYISENAFSENDSDPFRRVDTLLPTTPRYGISAVFVRIKEDEEDDSRSLTLFTFLPSSLTHAPDDGVSSPLAFDSPPISQIVPGNFIGRKWSWLDHSGLNLVAALSQSRHGGCDKVFLVRYDPETMSTSVRALTDPLYFTGLETLDGLCVDATVGAVHLVENEGQVSTIRYVQLPGLPFSNQLYSVQKMGIVIFVSAVPLT